MMNEQLVATLTVDERRAEMANCESQRYGQHLVDGDGAVSDSTERLAS